MKRIEALDRERVKILVSGKRLKRRQQLKSDDSQGVEDLEYTSEEAITKKSRSETIIKSIQKQLLPVQSNADEYRHRLSLYTEKSTADVTFDFSGFMQNLSTEAKNLVEKQRKGVETTVKTDVESIDSFLRGVDTALSRPGPFSSYFL